MLSQAVLRTEKGLMVLLDHASNWLSQRNAVVSRGEHPLSGRRVRYLVLPF
jgi:hypothetical protein